jgi:hypothetical protein
MVVTMQLPQPPIRDNTIQWPVTWTNWFSQLWRLASTIGQHGTTAQRPTSNLFVGRQFFDDDLQQMLVWSGSAWIAEGGGSSIPLPVSIVNGGTDGTTAAAARANLGLEIGTDVEAWDTDLDAIAGLGGTGWLERTGPGAWALGTPPGGSPGGSTTQIQYNNAGLFAGLSTMTTDGTVVTLSGSSVNPMITVIQSGAGSAITSAGDLTFTGSARRIYGDFSNGVTGSRLCFMSSTVNTNTSVSAAPNGTAVLASYSAYSSPTLGAASVMTMAVDGAGSATLNSTATGAGTVQPLYIQVGNNTQLGFPSGGAAVNYLTVQGSTTTNPVVIATAGADATSDIKLSPRGAGKTIIGNGNFNFGTTGQRITGDFSNSTIANRVLFQSSTTNGPTAVAAIPNGTSTVSQMVVFAGADPDNASKLAMVSNVGGGSVTGLVSSKNGTGAFWPLVFYTSDLESFRIDLSQNIVIADANDIQFATTTGTKIGTATTEKLAFHNSTPVIQRAGVAQAAVATTAATNVTPYGFTTAAQADAIVTLVNELRAALVEKGLIKGSA